MSKLTTILMLCFGFACAASSVEGVCQRCIEAQRNNAANQNPYFYYEDYQDAKVQGRVHAQPQAQAPRR